MARGLGKARLLAEIGKEQAFETKRYEEELKAAEDAARKESEGASAWQGIGSTAAALFTFLTTKDIQKTAEAWTAGGEAAKWGHRLVSGYDPEDYQISTDMGRFDVQDSYKMADVNRQFEEAHTSRFWRDVAGTGQALGTMALLGGDSEGAPESAWKRFLKLQGTPAETLHSV